MHNFVTSGTTILLGFVVVPVWILAGFADFFCHRASNIEHTSGVPESLMHLAQFGLVGLPLLLALFFRADAGLLLILAAFAAAHHVVAFADLQYATRNRVITPVEQMVHSFLELLPLTAWLLLASLHFDQLVALSRGSADFALRLEPKPIFYVAGVLIAAAIFGLVPYLLELRRCIAATADARAGM